MPLHLKTVNDELAKRGHKAVLGKADNHFFFSGPDTKDWLDRTVGVRTINTFTLKQWMEEFLRLRELNAQIVRSVQGKVR